jgi:hypothetical protein
MLTQNRNRIRMILLAVVLITPLAFGGMSVRRVQAGGPPPLFGDAGDAHPTADAPNASYMAHSRFVSVNVGMLFDASGKPLDKQSLPEIALNLFPDVSYTGVVTRAWQDNWGDYWTGRLNGVQGGYFYLTVVDGAFMAHVASGLGVYEVSFAGDNLYRAIQIDQSKFVDHDPAAKFDPPGAVIPEGSLGATADSAAQIDIMVVYTDDARAAAGSTAAMKATILTALNETNQSYANDGVTTRLRLVHVQEYSYAETGDLFTDLARLTNTTDAYFSTVHSLRNTYAADMVGLIVEHGGPYCGLANAVMATASNAFQVTARSCTTGYYSFGHEFGHLQGARHDVYVDPGTTPYAYGHGYVHTGTTAATRWRTIMAYDAKCNDLGYSCTRLQWWSNPVKTWLGAAMGNAQSKNYQVLNNTAYTVANFRKAVIGRDFKSSFNGSSSGWSAVSSAWSLYNAVNYRSAGEANLFASASHSGTYGDLTYEVSMKRTGTCTSCANHISIRGTPAPLDALKKWNKEYRFAYSNAGRFSVWEVNGASETALKPWTTSATIVAGNWNTLKVVAVGSSLKFYINGTLVWSGTDTSYQTGTVGFGFTRNAAAGTLYVDWARLTNTPTADFNIFEAVAPGVEVPGGNINQSP